MYTEHGNRGGGFAAGLMFGAAVGAALGFMFAPRSGAEMRRQLKDSTSRLRRTAAEGWEQVAERGRELADTGREAYEEGREGFERAAEDVTSNRPGTYPSM